ncbi:hypothetical protein EVAR_103840_1 [Eumeta japonica]|uniref:Uncharacterized protein n=1 Tax=Eumeta variegata TaxID=151549 RepID=A0A4C2AET0_EUMVA|nr:hypothetical protein EVAR_103840_1 [Eumeta japonica]
MGVGGVERDSCAGRIVSADWRNRSRPILASARGIQVCGLRPQCSVREKHIVQCCVVHAHFRVIASVGLVNSGLQCCCVRCVIGCECGLRGSAVTSPRRGDPCRRLLQSTNDKF